MKISRDNAVAMLVAMGHKTAKNWNGPKLKKQFNALVVEAENLEEEELEDDDLDGILQEIIELDYGEEVTIVNKEPAKPKKEEVEDDEDEFEEDDEEDGENDEEDGEDDEEDGENDEEDDEEDGENDEEDDEEPRKEITVGTTTFVLGDYVQVDDPQDRGLWVGKLKEIQNDEWGLLVTESGKEWEVAFEFMTKSKVQKGKKPKVVRLTRPEMAMKVIKEMKGTNSIKKMCALADGSFVNQGAACKPNVKMMAVKMNTVIDVLEYFGALKVNGDKITLV